MSLPAPDRHSTIVITGASSGIGSELARGLARRGYNLTLVARRKPQLTELATEIETDHAVTAEVRTCNLASDRARSNLITAVREGGREVVGVVNNAGFGSFGRFQDLELEREQEMVRTNVLALHDLTGAFLDGMVRRGAGAVLNVASVASFQPLPGNTTYAATKAFVLSVTEALSADLSSTGVSATALCPGPVKTEFAEVAGIGGVEGSTPDFVWQTPQQVAEAGINGMLRGKRVVVPGLPNRLAAAGGRLAPRSILLPVMDKLGPAGLAERALKRSS